MLRLQADFSNQPICELPLVQFTTVDIRQSAPIIVAEATIPIALAADKPPTPSVAPTNPTQLKSSIDCRATLAWQSTRPPSSSPASTPSLNPTISGN